MSNFIFNATNNQSIELLYVLKGYEDFIDNDDNPRTNDANSGHIVAKCIQNKKPKHFADQNSNFTYFILSSPNDDLYNPLEYNISVKDKRRYDFIDKTCKKSWAFREVSKITFDKYLTFLKTKNVSWFKDAQRDLK